MFIYDFHLSYKYCLHPLIAQDLPSSFEYEGERGSAELKHYRS